MCRGLLAADDAGRLSLLRLSLLVMALKPRLRRWFLRRRCFGRGGLGRGSELWEGFGILLLRRWLWDGRESWLCLVPQLCYGGRGRLLGMRTDGLVGAFS